MKVGDLVKVSDATSASWRPFGRHNRLALVVEIKNVMISERLSEDAVVVFDGYKKETFWKCHLEVVR